MAIGIPDEKLQVALRYVPSLSHSFEKRSLIRQGDIGNSAEQNTDAGGRTRALCMRRNRQSHSTAEEPNKIAPPHSITSSARARSVGGIVRPRDLAVPRLITNSNMVGCSTGRVLGCAPFRILST